MLSKLNPSVPGLVARYVEMLLFVVHMGLYQSSERESLQLFGTVWTVSTLY